MKFIGQYIQDFIARFRNDVYLEDISTGTIASGGNLGLDSNNKIVKANSQDAVTLAGTPDYITISGQEITRNSIDLANDVTGVLPSANLDADTAHLSVAQTFEAAKTFGTTAKLQFRDANAYINSPTANDLTVSATDITLDAAGSVFLDVANGQSVNFQENGTTVANINAHHNATYFTMFENEGASTDDYLEINVAANGASQITTNDTAGTDASLELRVDGAFSVISTGIDIAANGTITNATWNGTAIATDQQKHLAYFEFKGYGTSDGTNYEMPEQITDANAPFEHDTSTGSDGLTAQTIQTVMRSGGVVMPYTGVLKKFQGWATSAGSGTVNIALFKFTPTDDTAGNLTPVQLVNESITASGNAIMNSFSETSSFDAGFTAGDIIYPAVKGSVTDKTFYFNSTLVVEWS